MSWQKQTLKTRVTEDRESKASTRGRAFGSSVGDCPRLKHVDWRHFVEVKKGFCFYFSRNFSLYDQKLGKNAILSLHFPNVCCFWVSFTSRMSPLLCCYHLSHIYYQLLLSSQLSLFFFSLKCRNIFISNVC